MKFPEVMEWLEAIHEVVMETVTLDEYDGAHLWWLDVLYLGCEGPAL